MPTSGSAATRQSAEPTLYRRATRWWVALSYAAPRRTLALVLIVGALGAWTASSLRIDTDLRKLLPRSYPAVKQMDVAISKIGDLGYFSVIIDHEDQEESIRYATSLAKLLESSPYVRTVFLENPVDFLRKNRFLLTPAEDLRQLRDYVKRQRRERSPFNLSLLGNARPAADTTGGAELEALKKAYASIDGMKRFHVSDDGRILAMQIRPKQAVTNLSFVGDMHAHLLSQTVALKADGYSERMKVHVGGSLKNKLDEYDLITSDIRSSLLRSGLLILLVLLLFFRNPVSVGVLLLPLGVGLAWSFAVAELLIGYLNTLSGMLLVVLFGLGIDHGIHLLQRYIQLRRDGRDGEGAMRATLTETGRAVWISASTTAGGFLVMLVADFRGFSHLGLIAGTAMLLDTLAYSAALPALCALVDRRGILQRTFGPELTRRPWARWAELLRRLPARLGTLALAGLLVTGLGAAMLLEFNYDFDTFKGTVAASEAVKAKQAKVYTESLTPGAVIFARDDDELDAILTTLRQRRAADEESPTIGRLVSIRDFLPKDQGQRLELIRDAARLVTPLVLSRVSDHETKRILLDLEEAAALEPISAADVPAQVRAVLSPQDGSDDRVVFVFPSIERKQGRKAIAFADDMAPITLDSGMRVPTGGTLIFAEVLRTVIDQGLIILALSLLAIAILLAGQSAKRSDVLHILLALFGGLGTMALLLLALPVDINFYNMVIFAAVVGMGVDSSVHLVTRYREETVEPTADPRFATDPLARAVAGIAGPITACALTTMAGYLGMVFSHHPGLRGIGLLAVIGLSACWLVSISLAPIHLRRYPVVERSTDAAET